MDIELFPKNHKKEILRLHNNFINAIFNLSTDAKKLLLVIWLHTNENGKNIKIYRADILNKVGIDLKNLNSEHREKIIEELMKTIVTIRSLDNPNNFIKIQLVYKTKYEDGVLYTNIDEELLRYIQEAKEKLFTRFKIQNIKPMTSSHAIRIYLLLKQFDDTGWREMNIEEFRKILELEYKYKQITDLKKRVLEVAKKQINENTDIEMDYELVKQGRKYMKIRFLIKNKEKKEISQTNNRVINKSDDFNSFRQRILSKINEDDVIILDDNIYYIKDGLLYFNDNLLDKEKALKVWKNLYENKDRLQIKSKEELKKEKLQKIEGEVNKTYVGKKTFLILDGEYTEVVIVKIKLEDIDNIKVIFKNEETNKFYEVKFKSLESLKNL